MIQLIILTLTAITIFLTLRKRESLRFVGSAVGVVAQFFWFYETLSHEQWGFYTLSVVFFGFYVHGCFVYWPWKSKESPKDIGTYDQIGPVRDLVRGAAQYGLEGEVVSQAIHYANPKADPAQCVQDACWEWDC